ncbi:hypothetical protein [Streptococcus uberis]|uniref:hypothetical protein n=1 Tax=Streptococcus uberis TaxID=1349 RepID=UPI001FF2F396|nr:hypothetical protein [Streptococcus uberis]MCK1157641.1 hypothetical protein [Streptococcus uberis]MCK1250930.1 hypothetical protein [Streptococcus uberis]
MQNLRQFLEFKYKEFLLKKKLYFLGVRNLIENKGVKVDLLIIEDNTDYKNEKNNLGEKITVTVIGKKVEDFSTFTPMRTICKITDVTKASVYGDFQNLLSLTANVIKDGGEERESNAKS